MKKKKPKKKHPPKPRNPIAADLAGSKYRSKTVPNKKREKLEELRELDNEE